MKTNKVMSGIELLHKAAGSQEKRKPFLSEPVIDPNLINHYGKSNKENRNGDAQKGR